MGAIVRDDVWCVVGCDGGVGGGLGVAPQAQSNQSKCKCGSGATERTDVSCIVRVLAAYSGGVWLFETSELTCQHSS